MRRIQRLVAVLCAVLPALGGLASPTAAQPAPALLLILDASGSMWGQIEGTNKIVIAREVVGDLLDGLADDAQVGLVAYGHRREGDCADIETVVPIGALDRGALKAKVNALNPRGKTPITASVEEAFAAIAGRDSATTVILVSDGLETCGGDPCAAVKLARQAGSRFLLHVVGFDVAGEDVSQLECAAQAGGGLFFSAENAGQLSAALEQAVAMPAEVPAGRLVVTAVADGQPQDAAIHVTTSASGEEVGGGRTYTGPDTNPRRIPLPDGRFDVVVQAVGIKGAIERRFEIEIADGSTVEREVDYSTGELSVGVTRNGELSDAVYHVVLPGTRKDVASGRTYAHSGSNPARIRIVSGEYEVTVSSVEISGSEPVSLGTVVVPPRGQAEVTHAFVSGSLKVGAERGGELVDATLYVVDVATGRSVGQGRTYKSPSSNPKAFVLPPGSYRVDVNEIRGQKRTIEVTLGAAEEVVRMVDPAGG